MPLPGGDALSSALFDPKAPQDDYRILCLQKFGMEGIRVLAKAIPLWDNVRANHAPCLHAGRPSRER